MASVHCVTAEVPPGYYIQNATETLKKCPSNVNGTGYYRQGWISYSLGIDNGDGTAVCTPCGEGILSSPKEFDEAEALVAAFKASNNQALDDAPGLVAASGSSCCKCATRWPQVEMHCLLLQPLHVLHVLPSLLTDIQTVAQRHISVSTLNIALSISSQCQLRSC
jgi:hypothetical protein